MLSFIIIILVLSSLFRRPRYWGFPFMGGWGYRRPPMGWYHRPPMGDGVVSSSPDGLAAWHERPARHGRWVQGWPAWSWSLLTFPQFSGLVLQPARFFGCLGLLRHIENHYYSWYN